VKRPEGFDSGSRQQPQPPKRAPARAGAAARPPRAEKPSTPPEQRPPRASKPARIRPSRAENPGAAARTELRQAARERRRAEKAEVRRFTRRARNRRSVLVALSGLVAVLVALVLVAVYSPILALRTITVEGTSRIDATQVQAAVAGQLGTPLALVDFDRMTHELGAFPLIRSYVTETVPPDTLIIRIVERQPVAVVMRNGGYELVDPAGVAIALSPERPAGIPLIDLGTATVDSPGFRSAVEVLLSMPADLIGQVESIAASTQDDVTLVLVGGQRVQWGNAEDSAMKARVLAQLIAAIGDPSRAGTYDVSAPLSVVFTPDPVPPPPPTAETPPVEGEAPPEG
jgi:cell division protein FtsQ